MSIFQAVKQTIAEEAQAVNCRYEQRKRKRHAENMALAKEAALKYNRGQLINGVKPLKSHIDMQTAPDDMVKVHVLCRRIKANEFFLTQFLRDGDLEGGQFLPKEGRQRPQWHIKPDVAQVFERVFTQEVKAHGRYRRSVRKTMRIIKFRRQMEAAGV